MLNHVLFASAMTVATPAIAQQVAPAPQNAATIGASGTTDPQAAATTVAPSDVTAATDTLSGPARTQTAQRDPAAQGTNEPGQVAAILDSEFPTYDKDGSGALSKVEFAYWMDTLKAKADPSAKPDERWNDAAFKRADSDRSASVTKTELARFLSSGIKAG